MEGSDRRDWSKRMVANQAAWPRRIDRGSDTQSESFQKNDHFKKIEESFVVGLSTHSVRLTPGAHLRHARVTIHRARGARERGPRCRQVQRLVG